MDDDPKNLVKLVVRAVGGSVHSRLLSRTLESIAEIKPRWPGGPSHGWRASSTSSSPCESTAAVARCTSAHAVVQPVLARPDGRVPTSKHACHSGHAATCAHFVINT